MLTTCYIAPHHFMVFTKERNAFAWNSNEYRKPSAVVDTYTTNTSYTIPTESMSDFAGPFLVTSNYFVRK